MRRGDLDAVLLSPPFDDAGLEQAPLYEEEFLLALPSGHPLQRKRTLARPRPSREVALYWRGNFAGAESARLLAETIRDHLPVGVKPGR